MARVSRRRRKALVRGHLARRELDALRDWARREPSAVTPALVALLLELDDLVRWRAIEALGLMAADVAAAGAEGLERVRDLVRRQFWSMMEESGNLAWHAPEAIGEILYRVPALAPEYLGQLAGYDEFPFQPGIAWALARLAPAHPQPVRGELAFLQRALEHEDPLVRGNAALALVRLGEGGAARELVDDAGAVVRYDFEGGELVRTTVGALARAG